MTNSRVLSIWIIIALCFTTLYYISPNNPPTPDFLPQSPKPKTCLELFNATQLSKSIFDHSMVFPGAPTSIQFWVQKKTGFEIGGPSQNTWGNMGVYDVAAKVDVTNFASSTLWESNLKDGSPFKWKDAEKGVQYIRDAVDLHGIGNETYDFVLASHALEHIANPFKALVEWLRILRTDGILLLILPYKQVTFDHKRSVARIEHLIEDYHHRLNESDLSHLEEILATHDLERDPPAGDVNSFRARSRKNYENRAFHQHVYDQELLYRIFMCLNLDVKFQATWGDNDLIIGQKM